jgi:basic membrane protein A and related proteins
MRGEWMTHKGSAVVAFILIPLLLLSGCKKATPVETDCSLPDVLCVGLVTSIDGINDKSYNQAAWEGMQQAKSELGDVISYTETVDAKDYSTNMQSFIDKNYDVIITVGAVMGDATTAVATEFPGIKFIGVDQRQGSNMPNLAGLVFHEDQGGFLAGALAAQMTKTGTIAAVLGNELTPATVAFQDGYTAGAKYMNPDINIVAISHPGDAQLAFNDPQWGADTTIQAINKGADVVLGASGPTGSGALIETANHAGIYCIGIDTDQWEAVPASQSCLAASVIKLISPGVYDILKLTGEGNFPAGLFYGAYGLAPDHNPENSVSKTIRDDIAKIAIDLKTGAISTGYIPKR